MKKNIIALAIAAAVAAPVANAAPTVYGKLNLNLDNTTDKGTNVKSTASRLGVKGSNDLGNGLKAVYKLEFGVNIMTKKHSTGGATDTNASTGGEYSTSLSSRNQYLGLAGGFGTVLMGRHDTPLKMSQPVDEFNDGDADLKPMSGGLMNGGKGGEVRSDQVIAYVSPSFGGFKVVAAGITNSKIAKNAGITNTYSVAGLYGSKKKGLFLSGAYNAYTGDVTGTSTVAGKTYTEMRVSAQYRVAGLMVNGMYQNADDGQTADNATEGSNLQVQVAYKMGNFKPKLKYSMVDFKSSALKDGNAYSLGADYSLGKKTVTYLEYTNFDKHTSQYSVGGVAKSKTSIVVGMIHKF